MIKTIINNASQSGVFLSLNDEGNLAFELTVDEFPADIKAEIIENKQEIIEYFKSLKVLDDSSGSDEGIPKQPNGEALEASFGQKRFWTIDKIEGGSAHYNMPGALRLSGKVDIEAVNYAFNEVVKRHEILRTHYLDDEQGNLKIVVAKPSPLTISQVSLCHFTGTDQAEALQHTLKQEASYKFDLNKDILIRMTMIKLGEQEYIAAFNMHHIVSDGWSLGVLVKEFSVFYNAFTQSSSDILPELEIQYSDFAAWQNRQLQGEGLNKLLAFWQEGLADIPMAHSLPLDYARPQQPDYLGESVELVLPESSSQALKQLCEQHGATLFMGVHTIFSALIARYSNENDIVIGTPVAGREKLELINLIGLFLNTVVLRTQFEGNPSFDVAIQESKKHILEAFDHQAMPFDKLVDQLDIERSTSYQPVFQIMLAMQNNDEGTLNLAELEAETLSPAHTVAKFDLTVHVREVENEILLTWEYATALFKRETVETLAKHFNQLVREVVANPEKSLFALPLLDDKELQVIQGEWNATSCDYPTGLCMHELFIKQVAKTPDAIALIDEQGEMTYLALMEQVLLLAWSISDREVNIEELVAVRAGKGRTQVIATLAIQVAGGAYLPLETSWPDERCAEIINRANVKLCITDKAERAIASESECEFFAFESGIPTGMTKQQILDYCRTFEPRQAVNNLAYVIFTSGSTGVPKGVAIEHRSVVNTLIDINTKYAVTEKDRALCVSALSFDLSVYDIFGLLAVGGVVVFPHNADAKDPAHWQQQVEQHQITIWNTVPLSAGLLTEQFEAESRTCTAPLRLFLMSGDWIPTSLPSRLWACFENAALYSLGGATEGSIWSIHYPIIEDPSHLRSVPYGQPLGNQSFYILNSELQACPVGVTGELFIGGVGVAREYYNAPEISAKSFIWHPELNVKIYRTGDLGRYLPDGNIEFVGRIDNQLKIRGFRVELGDIESQLIKHPKIDDVHVIARQDGPGLTRLFAYLVSQEALDIASIRLYLKGQLPDYMIPNAFVVLDAFPLTANGKLDRKALPEPDLTQSQADYEAPVGEVEIALSELWASALGLEKVGRHDNFFELGGHSILGMTLISNAKKRDIHIEAKQFFAAKDLSELASEVENNLAQGGHFVVPQNNIDTQNGSISPEDVTLIKVSEEELDLIVGNIEGGVKNIQDIYPLSPAQEGFTFHYMLGHGEDPYILNNIFEIQSRVTSDDVNNAFKEIIARHDVLRTQFLWKGLSTPVQVVSKSVELNIGEVSFEAPSQDEEIVNVLSQHFVTRLPIESAPLIRLVKAKDTLNNRDFILIQCHHLVIDHVSLEIIGNELSTLLAGESLSEAKYQFRDQIAYIQERFDEEEANQYFSTYIGDLTGGCRLFDDEQGNTNIDPTESHRKLLPKVLSDHIRSLAKLYKVAPAAIFHTAVGKTLSVLTGKQDVTFGSVMSGRLGGAEGIEQAMGALINTLPFRIQFGSQHTESALMEVDAQLSKLVELEHAPLALAQKQASLASGEDLFNTIFNYRHTVYDKVDEQITGIRQVAQEERTNYPFSISVDDYSIKGEFEVEVTGQLKYINRLMKAFEKSLLLICENLSKGNATPLLDLELVTQKELFLSNQSNSSVSVEDGKSSLLTLFRNSLNENPEKVAIQTTEKMLTFQQLELGSNQLSNYLMREKLIKPASSIGVYLENSSAFFESVLAIIKANGVVTLLDPSEPSQQIETLYSRGDLSCILVSDDKPELNVPQVLIQSDSVSQCNSENSELHVNTGNSNHLIIQVLSSVSENQYYFSNEVLMNQTEVFTSSILAPLEANMLALGHRIDALDSICALTSLCSGYSLYPLSEDTLMDSERLNTELNKSNADVVMIDVQAAEQLSALPNRWQGHFIVDGMEMSRKSWTLIAEAQHKAQKRAFSVAGSGFAGWINTIAEVKVSQPYSLGLRAIDTDIAILNEDKQATRLGQSGHLYIADRQVSKGEKLPHHYEVTQGSLINTDIVVSFDEQGMIYPVSDEPCRHRIQGRRFNIESLHSALNIDGIDDFVLGLKAASNGNLYPAVIYTSKTIDSESLRARLLKSLPEYALPGLLLNVESLHEKPSELLISNHWLGSLAIASAEKSKVYSDTELGLLMIWQSLLGHDFVTMNESFFSQGGDLALAELLIEKINIKFQVHISLEMLKESASIESLALFIDMMIMPVDEEQEEEEMFL